MQVLWDQVDLAIPARDGPARVIGVIPHQIVTKSLEAVPAIREGQVVADPSRDLLKIVVLERHAGSGRTGLGLVRGIGLREGAIAGTVAHDHHNLIAVGADDGSILAAAKRVADVGGGLAVARDQEILATLALPVGGLMSTRPIQEVRRDLDALLAAARSLGSTLHDPFMAMSFLALEVIPTLKITDQGLVDVQRFEKVDFWI